MFKWEMLLVGLVLDFSGEGVSPDTSNPSTKPTAKASAKADNTKHQEHLQAHHNEYTSHQ